MPRRIVIPEGIHLTDIPPGSIRVCFREQVDIGLASADFGF